jgi:uncharacterized membrane protein
MKKMKFKNVQNNNTENVSSPLSWLWVLLLRPIYWAVQGVLRHAVVHLILAIITFDIAHLIYPFLTYSILRKHYLKLGWKEVK